MKKLYLIRHAAPFIEFTNYEDYKNISWNDFNRNMILSVEGEKNASKLAEYEELQGIPSIYASDSFRAIGTAKYLADSNHTKITLDSRINEREFGVEKISDLPEGFSLASFLNLDLKVGNGESLNEVYTRFSSFIEDFLESEHEKSILVIHGIILLGYLQKNCDFQTDGKSFSISFHEKEVLNGTLTNPDVFEITYQNHEIVDIRHIKK